MRSLGVVRYKNQPIERKTPPHEDLRTVINQTFLLVQNAAMECADVEATVWEESGKPGASHAKIFSITMNASKLPALLMRPATAGSSLPMLGDGATPSIPARAACPFCPGVADLVEDRDGISYQYACPSCGFGSAYSPAQLAAWSSLHPIRKDGNRLTMPKVSGKDSAVALGSYKCDDGHHLLALMHGEWSGYFLARIAPDGERQRDPDPWRADMREKDGLLGIAKTWLWGEADVEIHSAELEAAEPLSVWERMPVPATSEEALRALGGATEEDWSSWKILRTDGELISTRGYLKAEGDALALAGTETPLSAVGMLVRSSNPRVYGPEAMDVILWQRPGFDPAAAHAAAQERRARKAAKPEKKGKGKKTAAPDPTAERMQVLGAYVDRYEQEEDGGIEADDLYDTTSARIVDLRDGAIDLPENDEDLLDQWRGIYGEEGGQG